LDNSALCPVARHFATTKFTTEIVSAWWSTTKRASPPGERGGDKLEIGGFPDSEANLEVHYVSGDRILVLAQRGEQDLIQRLAAGAKEAIDLDGERFCGDRGKSQSGE